MHTRELVMTIVLICVVVGCIIGFSIWWCAKTSRFDSYDNEKNIKKAQKKLDNLTQKRKPNLSKIELAQKELDTAKLFSNCQRIQLGSYNGGSGKVLFSDDNKVIMFFNNLIAYDEIESYSIIENNVTKSHTKTKSKGVVSRAIVGGAIAGGVGAIVGGMTAGSESNTTYYQSVDGFYFRLFLKNKTYYTVQFRGGGVLSNKVPRNWENLAKKIQVIIDENNKE